MKREELLAALSAVDPALAANDLIPVLTHYWFTGRDIMAYNDMIAISVPHKTNLTGAIRGSLLGGILSKSKGQEVEFEQEGSNVIVKSGKSKLTAPLLATDAFLFKFPKLKSETLVLKKKQVGEFAAGMEICLQALSRRVSEPQRLGVTLVAGKNKLSMYATDSITLSAATITAKGHQLEGHVTIGKPFCEAAVKFLNKKGVEHVTIEITDEHILMHVGNTDECIKLYGRLVDDPNPPVFKDVVAKYLPEGSDESMVAIPKSLNDAFDRAHLVVAKALEPTTTLKVSNTKGETRLRIAAKSEHGSIDEQVKLDEHDDVTLSVDLSRLRDCDLSKFDRILFDEACIVLGRGSDMLHLVASI